MLAALVAGAGGCAYVSACTEKLRLEVKDDLKPLVSLNTNVALIQETLKTQQETLKTQQEMLKAQQETLATLQAKVNASLLLGMLGLAATIAMLSKSK